MQEQFRHDVKKGLSAVPKSLSSQYFYDQQGDLLFQKIMELEEYYLTDCEYEILGTYKNELLDHFNSSCDGFHLIEFGAGDAFKTKVLISFFLSQKIQFEYNPIDISENAVQNLVSNLHREYPDLKLLPVNMEYFSAVEEISRHDSCKKIILFLGSNIGNFSMDAAQDFFNRLGSELEAGDLALIGFDLRKDPETILNAYNDPSGITAEFNLNLLRRINRELEADFDPVEFYHQPEYNPDTGAAKSFLISKKTQEIKIGAIPMTVSFREAEPIFMEISQKYKIEDVHRFAENAGFIIKSDYFDKREYFLNSLWEKK